MEPPNALVLVVLKALDGWHIKAGQLAKRLAIQCSTARGMQNRRMPNIATALKDEIARLARKELRAETSNLVKAASTHRSEIAALKRRVAELEKALKVVHKSTGKAAATPATTETADGAHRFRAAGLANNRARLGLSAADFGLLIGATGQSIYAWEQGRSKPRPKNLAAIAALRGLGKKEVAVRLEALKATK